MDRNPVLQQALHTFNNNTNTNTNTNNNNPTNKLTTVDHSSFLDGLEFSHLYQQPSQASHALLNQQNLYNNGYYQPTNYMYSPQRYNSNQSSPDSPQSTPVYIPSTSSNSMMHYYSQQQHLQQLQQPHNHLLQTIKTEHIQTGGSSIQKKKQTKTKRKRQAKIIDPNAPPKPKRKTGLNKPLILSPPLSKLMDGERELSRPELVQRLWKYIKSNNLQDPSDRRFILCDEKLKKIFDQDRINSFGMNKDLSAHLTKKEDVTVIKQEEEEAAAATTTTTAATAAAVAVMIHPKEDDFLLNL